MASYKVPQDVEAEDKLLGPFSFRQFMYLIGAVIAAGVTWGLGVLFLPLAIIPLPAVLFFGALALPLRKDQPMEVYLAAVVSFYVKPRKRLWKPDGLTSLVEITAPRVVETQRTKGLSEGEAERRLSYLAGLVDTRGWAVRGVNTDPNSAMRADQYWAAQQAEDVLDDNTAVARSLDTMIKRSGEERRQKAIASLHRTPQTEAKATLPAVITPITSAYPEAQPPQPTQPPIPEAPELPELPPVTSAVAPTPPLAATEPTPAPVAKPTPAPAMQPPAVQVTPADIIPPVSATPVITSGATPTPDDDAGIATPTFNPYPRMRQSVIQPLSRPDDPPASPNPISPDIINLANQRDLSVATIQHEAQRLQKKQATPGRSDRLDEEVVVSLH